MEKSSERKAGLFARLFKGAKTTPSNDKRPKLVYDPRDNIEDFQPEPLDMCFCGSGEFFKACCGSTENDREPPYGVFVFENYLSGNVIKELRSYLDTQPGEPLTVIDEELSTADNIVTKMDNQRRSDRVDMGDYYSAVNKIMRKAFIDLSEECIGLKMDWYEPPQLLRYHANGFYNSHSDAENMNLEKKTWSKVIDRDLSLLIYLNDDFEGGNLLFDKFNYTIRPKAGTAVLFPSDHRYLHTAQTVHKGIRQALVSWGAVTGVRKISSNPPEGAIMINFNQ